MRWEVTTTATSRECRTLRRFGDVPDERAFLVDAGNRLKALAMVRSVGEKVLRIERACDDEVTAARERRAIARAVARHPAVAHASPVEELVTR